MSRLAEIYKSEKQKGGGLTSTLGKRFLEKIDPRQMFDQSGLLAAMLPSLFKSYSATGKGKGGISSIGSSKLSTPSSFSSVSVETKLDDIYISNKLIAKNSMVLPSMHRDINVMRQNVVKLVKLQGGTAATKADMYFTKAKDREAQYENQFKREKDSRAGTTGGTQSTSTGGGLLQTIFGGLGKISDGIGTGVKIAAIGLGIGGFIAGVSAGVGLADKLGSPESLKQWLKAVGEGLGAFSAESMGALKVALATGGLFGAVAGGLAAVGGAKVAAGVAVGATTGIGLIGFALGGFITGLASALEIASKITSPDNMKLWLTSLAEGIEPFSKIDGSNFINVGTGMAALSVGILGLFTGTAIQSLKEGYKWLKSFFTEEDGNKKTLFETLAEQLKALEKVDSTKIKDVGEGFKDIVDSVDKLRGISDEEIANVGKKIATVVEQAKAISQLNQVATGAGASSGTFVKTSGAPTGTSSSPTPYTAPAGAVAPGTGAAGTFNALSEQEQLQFLQNQFKAEGNKPGNLAYDLNNPGAMLYSPWQQQFGGVPDTTGRGTIYDKNGRKVPFARFPSLEQGFQAQRYLWQRDYGNRPMGEAIARWSGTQQGTAVHSNYMATTTGMKGAPAAEMIASTSTAVADAQRQVVAPVVVVPPTQTAQAPQQSVQSGNLAAAEVGDRDLMQELFRKRGISYT